MALKEEEHKIFIPGDLGKLQAVFHKGTENNENKATGIICHPHPLFQGTMENKVVTTLARAWQGLHFSTIRFNFRGVGESEGAYGEGEGEIEDLHAVIKWSLQEMPENKIWLAGFSFGAMIAAKVAAIATQTQQYPICGLITIAPAVQFFKEPAFTIPSIPWLIVQGKQDEIVPLKLIEDWYQTLKGNVDVSTKPLPEFVVLPEATHFFHGHLGQLKSLVEAFTLKYR